jgi:hypothetical protein
MIECEGAFTTGGFDWRTFLLTAALFVFLLPIGIGFVLFRWREHAIHSRGKGYQVPLMACTACQRSLRDARVLESCLRKVPVFEQLLEKYPDARYYVVDR